MKRFVNLILIFCSFTLVSQNGELGMEDCAYAKQVIVPFNYSSNPTVTVKPLLNQKVFYSFREQFSFWYKIIVKEDHILNYKVRAINDSDSYSVYVYNYNLPDVCNKIYYQKIAPVKSTFFIGRDADKFNDNERAFRAKKDNIYYINVLNTSLNNCGHRFWLVYGNDTLHVEALHLPCKREITGVSLVGNGQKDSIMKPVQPSLTVAPKPEIIKPMETVSSFFIQLHTLNAKNKKPVEARISVTEKQAGGKPDVVSKGKGEFDVMMEEAKVYSVKAEALGYKAKEITLSGTEMKLKQKEEILLEPIREGESFIMKSIYFVPNTYALRKESLPEMETLVAFMKSNESTMIEIQGHTNGDNRIYKNKAYASLGASWNFSGSSKKLSQKRAEVIKTYLVNHGVAEGRMAAKGYGGKKYLVKDPETNEEAQKNIRVEVSVTRN